MCLCTGCSVEEEWEDQIDHNCVPVNETVEDFSFSLDGIKEVAQFVSKGDWLASFDLKDGYTHVRIREDFRKYFGVVGRVRRCAYARLGFGFKLSPVIFQTLMGACGEEDQQVFSGGRRHLCIWTIFYYEPRSEKELQASCRRWQGSSSRKLG